MRLHKLVYWLQATLLIFRIIIIRLMFQVVKNGTLQAMQNGGGEGQECGRCGEEQCALCRGDADTDNKQNIVSTKYQRNTLIVKTMDIVWLSVWIPTLDSFFLFLDWSAFFANLLLFALSKTFWFKPWHSCLFHHIFPSSFRSGLNSSTGKPVTTDIILLPSYFGLIS